MSLNLYNISRPFTGWAARDTYCMATLTGKFLAGGPYMTASGWHALEHFFTSHLLICCFLSRMLCVIATWQLPSTLKLYNHRCYAIILIFWAYEWLPMTGLPFSLLVATTSIKLISMFKSSPSSTWISLIKRSRFLFSVTFACFTAVWIFLDTKYQCCGSVSWALKCITWLMSNLCRQLIGCLSPFWLWIDELILKLINCFLVMYFVSR